MFAGGGIWAPVVGVVGTPGVGTTGVGVAGTTGVEGSAVAFAPLAKF
jgi:hypothetical protein